MNVTQQKYKKNHTKGTGFKEWGTFLVTGGRSIVEEHARTALFLIITLFAPYAKNSGVFLAVAGICSLAYFIVSIVSFKKIREGDELVRVLNSANNRNSDGKKKTTPMFVYGSIFGVLIPLLAWLSSVQFSSGIERSIEIGDPTMQFIVSIPLILIAIIGNFTPEIMIANWKREERLAEITKK